MTGQCKNLVGNAAPVFTQYGHLQEDLLLLVQAYYKERGLSWPDKRDASAFLVTEAAEVLDAITQSGSSYVRNNPDKKKDIEGEIGDTLMMLLVTACMCNYNILDAMINKMDRKLEEEYVRRSNQE